jgi:hypothetical protein
MNNFISNTIHNFMLVIKQIEMAIQGWVQMSKTTKYEAYPKIGE